MQYQPSTLSGKYGEKTCPCCGKEGTIVGMKYDQEYAEVEHTYICSSCNTKWKEQYATMYIGFTDGKYKYGVEGDAFQTNDDEELARHNFDKAATTAAAETAAIVAAAEK